MKKKMLPKIMAFIALFWIIISFIWVWILSILSPGKTNNNTNTTMTKEELEEFVRNYKTSSWTIKTSSWNINILTNSWIIDNTWSINISTWVLENIKSQSE
jgi:hypothetical protein